MDTVKSLCTNNSEYFSKDCSEIGIKLRLNFNKISKLLENSPAIIEKIESFAGIYDFDEDTPGNGYRSFIFIFHAALKHTEITCKYIVENRGKFLFRRNVNNKEIAVCSQLIESLLQIAEGLIEMHEIADTGKLCGKSCHYDNIITRAAKVINQECFYGRAIGFQYFESLRPTVKFVACSMASFSEFYYSNKNVFSKTFDLITKSRKYFLDPELCAQRVCDISLNADIHFLSICDSKPLHTVINISGYGVDVNRTFDIKTEPLKLYSEKLQKFVDIPIPLSHLGEKPIRCRLISAHRRMEMIGEEIDCTNLIFSEPSSGLLIHVHGGGWISQSSKSHEIYLREWAVKLDVPILSIDYSLAPEAQFPRALEEVFYAYCWALKNAELLGSTGENIVIAGDSAGGNLAAGCIIKCIELGVPSPKGLFAAYSTFLVNFVKFPSRFMGLLDSFLTYGVIMKIFKSYGNGKPLNVMNISTGNPESSQKSKKNPSNEIPKAVESDFIFEIPRSYLLSPYWAPENILKEFPPTRIVTMITDPCLDECVDFAKKLKSLKVDTQIKVLEGLVHGFLSFTQVSKEYQDGSMICMQKIAELLKINLDM